MLAPFHRPPRRSGPAHAGPGRGRAAGWVLLLASLGGAAGQAAAGDTGSLAAQLRAYAERAGVQLVFDPDLLAGRTASGAPGGQGAVQADLHALLRGSGLEAVALQPGTWIIRRTDAAGTATTTLDALQVRGSRLRQARLQGAPESVWRLDREAIARSGAASLGQLLRQLPQVHESQYSQVTNTGFGDGRTEINLRGLGPERTLLLIDGLRLHGQDPDVLPLAAIEQVELLAAGAGVAYGSDAVAGVVNLRTRRWIQGRELRVTAQAADAGDGRRVQVDLAAGAGGERLGDLSAVLSLSDDAGVRSRDRAHARHPQAYLQGTLAADARASTPLGGLFRADGALAERYGCRQLTADAGQWRCARLDRTRAGHDYYNGYADHYLWIPARRAQLALGWHRDGAALTAETSLQLGLRRTRNALPSQILGSGELEALGLDPTLSADSVYNPWGADVRAWSVRLGGAEPRRYTFDNQFLQWNTRLRSGDRPVRWSLAYSAGWSEQRRHQSHAYDLAAIAAGLGPSFLDGDGQARCGSPGAVVAGCVPVDLFDAGNAALRAGSRPIGNRSQHRSHAFEADLESGIEAWPWGPLTLGAGLQLSRQQTAAIEDVDPRQQALGERTPRIWSAERARRELYAEMRVPLWPGASSRNDRGLELQAGLRWPELDAPGAPRYRLALQGSTGAFGLHAVHGQVYRLPSLEELYGNSQGGRFYNLRDPCVGLDPAALAAHAHACGGIAPATGRDVDSLPGHYIANPALAPEQGHSQVLRLSWRREAERLRWRGHMDLWQYRLRDSIVFSSPQQVVDSCFASAASPLCGDAEGRRYLQRDANGQLSGLRVPAINAGGVDTRGADFGLDLEWSARATRLGLELRLGYLDRYRMTLAGESPGDFEEVELAGRFDSYYTRASYPRVRGELRLRAARGDWELELSLRHIGGMREHDIDASPGAGAACSTDAPAVIPGVAGCWHDVPAARYLALGAIRAARPGRPGLQVRIDDLTNEAVRPQYSNLLYGLPNPLYRVQGRSLLLSLDWRWQ